MFGFGKKKSEPNPLGMVKAQQHLARLGYGPDGQTPLGHPAAGQPGFGDWARAHMGQQFDTTATDDETTA